MPSTHLPGSRFFPRILAPRLRTTLLVLLVPLVVSSCGGGADAPGNVLLVIVDTLRADHLGCYGRRIARTPNMDRLAQKGHRFHNTISQVPVTTPSTSTILTGLYPQMHGIRDNGKWSLSPSVTTMAEVFSENGYATAAFVSAAVLESKYGLDQGFDLYDDDVTTPWKFYNSRYQVKTKEHQNVERRAEETTNRAVPWIREHKGERFLLVVHYFDPHDPYDPPPSHQQVPGGTNYDGEIYYADDNLGRLIQALDWEGILDRTLVVVTADHGEGLKQHNEMSHGFFLYDTTVRVPLIFKGPGVDETGGVTEQVVRLVDVAPTILDLCGILPEGFGQGRSLAPILRGEGPLEPEPAYMETYRVRYSYGWKELVGLRTESWKYVRAPRSELYDLVADPNEMTNLFERNPKKAEELSRRLDHLLLRTEAEEPIASELPPDEESQRKLQALGYISTSAAKKKLHHETDEKKLIDPKDGVQAFADRQYAKDLIWQGKALLEQGKKDEAWEKIKEALAKSPRLATANYNMGLFYQFDKQYDTAREYYLKSVEYDPAFTKGWMSLGVLAYADHQDEKSREYFLNAYHTDPQGKNAFNVLLSCLRTGAYDEALAFLEELEEKNPNDAGTMTAIGYVYFARGDLEKEYEYWTEISLQDPENPTARQRLYRLGLWRASPRAYDLMRNGQYRQAIPILENLFEKNPSSYVVGDALVFALGVSGQDRAKAFQLNKELMGANPSAAGWYLMNEGILDFLEGRKEEANAALEKAQRRLQGVYEPYLSMLRYYQGRVAGALGDKRRAKLLYSTALSTSLGEPWEADAWKAGGVRLLIRHEEARRLKAGF